MTAREAAERLEISLSLLYRLVEEKRLPCVRIGGRGKRGKIIIGEAADTNIQRAFGQLNLGGIVRQVQKRESRVAAQAD